MMNQPQPERNTAPRPQKAHAPRCAKCNRKLSVPGTVIPGLGVVGPECEKQVADRLAHLQRQGLGLLALTGEQRIPVPRNVDGTYTVPHEAIAVLTTLANRVGLTLRVQFDPTAREFVITVDRAGLQAFIRRAEGAEA